MNFRRKPGSPEASRSVSFMSMMRRPNAGRERMNDALEEFFLRVAFADGFPADLGEAGVLEQGGGDCSPKVALSLRDR